MPPVDRVALAARMAPVPVEPGFIEPVAWAGSAVVGALARIPPVARMLPVARDRASRGSTAVWPGSVSHGGSCLVDGAGPADRAGAPGAGGPWTDKSCVDKPGVDKPGVDKPGVDKPGVDKPGVDRPCAGGQAPVSRRGAAPLSRRGIVPGPASR
jgi:hypothetical protein